MNIDLVGVGTGVEGCNESQINFTIEEYNIMAQKLIRHIAPGFRAGLAEEMLASEDAISNVATKLMLADGKWDGRGTQAGFRKQRAEYAIRDYMSRDIKAKKHGPVYSLNHTTTNPDTGGTCEFGDMIPDKGTTPLERMVQSEELDLIDRLLGSGVITENQEHCVRGYYFEGLTYQQLGEELGVSKQRVEQLVNQGIKNLQRLTNGNTK